ncbi:MAG: hypothetical protein LC715_01160 [Gammaproteobacteria bacterium]|nr:hypothetical protein [Gammaproteobacteria bacterium]
MCRQFGGNQRSGNAGAEHCDVATNVTSQRLECVQQSIFDRPERVTAFQVHAGTGSATGNRGEQISLRGKKLADNPGWAVLGGSQARPHPPVKAIEEGKGGDL